MPTRTSYFSFHARTKSAILEWHEVKSYVWLRHAWSRIVHSLKAAISKLLAFLLSFRFAVTHAISKLPKGVLSIYGHPLIIKARGYMAIAICTLFLFLSRPSFFQRLCLVLPLSYHFVVTRLNLLLRPLSLHLSEVTHIVFDCYLNTIVTLVLLRCNTLDVRCISVLVLQKSRFCLVSLISLFLPCIV